jgi:hypothetical protein
MDYQRCTAYIIEIYATDPNEGCKIVVYRLQIMEICIQPNSDTDSIIALHQWGHPPLESGTLLGQMQKEYEKWEILEFCSGEL